MTAANHIALVEAEVRRMVRAVENNLTTRRDHPSYGYGKTSLNRDLERATGALLILALLEGNPTTTPGLIEGKLADDIRRLRQEIKDS